MMSASLMGALALGFCLHGGAGCMSPTIIRTDPTQVILKYGPWDTEDELLRLAQSFCTRYDKFAQRLAPEMLSINAPSSPKQSDSEQSGVAQSNTKQPEATNKTLFQKAHFACLQSSVNPMERS